MNSYKDIARNKPSFIKSPEFIARYRSNKLAEQDSNSYMSIFNNALDNKDYNLVETIVFTLPYQIPMSSCFAFSPLYDLEGNSLGLNHMVELREERLPLNFVTILPQSDKTYILYSYLAEDKEFFFTIY